MAKTRHTPEEQLLSLIEEGKDFARLKHKRRNVTPIIFGGIGRIWTAPFVLYKAAKVKIGQLKRGTGEASLRPVINILLMIAIALSGYLVIDFVFGSPDISHIYERPLSARQANGQGDFTKTAGQTFLSYLAMVQRRNIFSPILIEGTQTSDIDAQKQELKKTATELSANLRLAGISLSPEPQAMIENKETNETLFLKKGDMINKLMIEEIHPDRVVLSYEGQTIELI
jgi:hypothetical protein